MRNSKNITDRKRLKEFFRKGNLPGESDFEKLIDSTFNISDDKLDINENGLMIYPSENEKNKLLSFFEKRNSDDPTWVMMVSNSKEGGISFHEIVQSKDGDNPEQEIIKQAALFIQKDKGKIGIGTDTPRQQLEVNGLIASKGRMGSLREGSVAADGSWHNIFDTKTGLSGCHAYEIMAYAEGEKDEGKYALMHAIAICTLGNSKPKITKTSAYHGKWLNKIDIRWESRPIRISGELNREKDEGFNLVKWWKSVFSWMHRKHRDKYNLQIRTKGNYDHNKKLYFRVSELWNSDFMTMNL